MSIRIITGSTGTNHVTSQDDGSLNQVILGSKSVVLDIGEKLAAVVVDNNTVRISDGDLLLQGRHARIDAGTVEDMTIGTGTIEMNRNDLIVARYTLDVATGFENIELIVLEGAESTGSASDPAYNTGDIRTGSAIVDFPLYRVRIEGINIVGLVRLFEISGGANSSLIGNAYSATKSYKSGEYCIDNGIMWRSRIDNNIGNTPAENSYWTRASIANDVSTLNQNLSSFHYRVSEGKRQISDDGVNWENFNSGAELLWTNPAPTTTFNGQKVSIDLTDYEAVLIETKTNTGSDSTPRAISYIKKQELTCDVCITRAVTTDGQGASRSVKVINNTGITFGNNKLGTTNDNNGCIPTRIFGLKTAFNLG